MSALPTPPVLARRAPSRRTAASLALCLSGSLLAACGGGDEPAKQAAAATPSAVATTPAAPSKPPAPAATDPLTGRGQVPLGSVVVVKIDNSPLARRYHRGLDRASVMYQELMEGGATRFLAVYAPATADEVGPVRSIREGDLELLQQYGKVAVASSGGNAGVVATFARAQREGRVIDANSDLVPGPYRKAERRKDARNFFTSPLKIDQARPGGAKVKDIGLRFGPLPAGAGLPAPSASIPFSKITRVSVRYDAASGAYAVFQDGDRMKDFAPTNVILQHAKIRTTGYKDVLGNPTPFTATIGSGAAAVLRDGRRLAGTWRRLVGNTGTRFLDDKGRDLPLKPGPSLVLLVPAGTPLQLS